MKRYGSILFFVLMIVSKNLDADPINTAFNPSTGDSISVWSNYTITGFNIFASIQSSGVWSTAVAIADPSTDPKQPLADINSSGNIVAIWGGTDPLTATESLYGSFYISGVWTTPALLTDPLSERPYTDYQVYVADDGRVVLTWTSYLFASGDVKRAIYCSSFGTWGSPINIP